MADETTTSMDQADRDHKNTILIASIVTAAVVSAVTAGYIVWRKSYQNRGSVDSVQDLLDKAHNTLHLLEGRLEDLRETVSLAKNSDIATA